MVKEVNVYVINFKFYICTSFYKMISLCMYVYNLVIKNMTFLFKKDLSCFSYMEAMV